MQKRDERTDGWTAFYNLPTTAFGRREIITVIKSLILSTFVHLFISIPITKTILQEIETLIYTYLWGGKPDKVSRKDIYRTYLKDGLEMINLYNFEKSLKLGWLKKLNTDQSKGWFKILETTIADINKLYRVGTKWIQTLDSKINPFWCSVFTYWDLLTDILVTNQDILTSCIWYNSKLATNKTFFPDWYKKGIHIVGDIFNENGRVMP